MEKVLLNGSRMCAGRKVFATLLKMPCIPTSSTILAKNQKLMVDKEKVVENADDLAKPGSHNFTFVRFL